MSKSTNAPFGSTARRRIATADARRRPGILELRLYVSGGAPNSVRALANLEALRRDHFGPSSRVEIVDVLRDPDRALRESVLLTPMLVKLGPGRPARILGNLGDTQTVLVALGLTD